MWEASASVAARIESSGESGSIQVTTFTYQVLKNKYIFEERGIITVKGKGRMVTYCLQEKNNFKHFCAGMLHKQL